MGNFWSGKCYIVGVIILITLLLDYHELTVSSFEQQACESSPAYTPFMLLCILVFVHCYIA